MRKDLIFAHQINLAFAYSGHWKPQIVLLVSKIMYVFLFVKLFIINKFIFELYYINSTKINEIYTGPFSMPSRCIMH